MPERNRLAAFLLVGLAACSVASSWIPSQFGGSAAPVSSTQVLKLDAWNREAAASYLDGREHWWAGWKSAARGESTFCISCHTSVPYVLARPELRGALAETGPSPDEARLIENVVKRVRNWKTIEPYYRNSKDQPHQSEQSRGTESVLNAFILSNQGARTGRLSDDTRVAFENMWSEQLQTGDDQGSWPWQQFALEPWESEASRYYGATLAIAAVGMAPQNYRAWPQIQGHLDLLRRYLDSEYERQSLYNRIALLWAGTKFPGLLDGDRRTQIIREVLDKQHSDGGWSLSSLILVSGWNRPRLMALLNRRRDGTPQETASDGFATGMIVSTLLQAGTDLPDPHLQRALDWLIKNQNPSDGSWSAYSVNQKRDPESNVGRFMSDSATGYAVLALSEADSRVQARVAQ